MIIMMIIMMIIVACPSSIGVRQVELVVVIFDRISVAAVVGYLCLAVCVCCKYQTHILPCVNMYMQVGTNAIAQLVFVPQMATTYVHSYMYNNYEDILSSQLVVAKRFFKNTILNQYYL